MTDATDRQIIFGIRGEWKDFEKRHPLFFERFPHLGKALNTAFIRTGTSSEAIEKFVFLYGRLCSEDFFEVLLCCGNGYGAAAQKLVRSLYERAVTLQYLHEHPEELNEFLDYHYIQNYKLVGLSRRPSAREPFRRTLLQKRRKNTKKSGNGSWCYLVVLTIATKPCAST
jgi:Family of unknown function (DUF5677)